MACVSFRNVRKDYGEVKCIHDFNLEIYDREFVVFVGPSGCGKSTALRMVAGLEEITEGDIFIGDVRINDVKPKNRNIAMVFQNYALYPHMTVYDNMAFPLKMQKKNKREIEERVKSAAKILGIEEYLHRKPKALSGGQRQRVALGRAIVREPNVFLMDEPLSNLDAKLRVQMRLELKELHRRLQTTIIYVTHDQIEAMTLGDRVVVLKDGLIQQVGKPYEIYQKPQNVFVAGFLGSPTMNFIRCQLISENNELHAKTQGFSGKLSNEQKEKLKEYKEKDIVVGIRPENILFNLEEGIKYGNLINANVDVAELVGADTFIHLKTGSQSISALVKSDYGIIEEKPIQLTFKSESLHLFDINTEKAFL